MGRSARFAGGPSSFPSGCLPLAGPRRPPWRGNSRRNAVSTFVSHRGRLSCARLKPADVRPSLDEHQASTEGAMARDLDQEMRNKALVLEAFDALFNRRDFAAAEKYWSPTYIQHSAGIAPGRDGLLSLVHGLTRRYESSLAVAEGDYVMVHGRFTGGGRPTRIVVDILRIEGGRLAEHWDVVQDEATKAESKSGLPMFGEAFPE